MNFAIILGFACLILVFVLMSVGVVLGVELLPSPIWNWNRGDFIDRLCIIAKALFIIALETILIACAIGIITELIILM